MYDKYMNKTILKNLSLLIASFLLVSCGTLPTSSTIQTSSSTSTTSSIETSSQETSSETTITSTSTTTTTQTSTSADTSAGNTTSESTQTTTTQTPTDLIPSRNEFLPIGNTSVSGPKNSLRDDIAEWRHYDLKSTLPDYFSYIQGNNKVNHCGDFYSTENGGFKFSKLFYGIQTPLITSFKKVEVSLYISEVNGNTKKADKDAPVLHIYSYDKDGYYLGMETIDQGRITMQSVNTKIKFYIRNVNMAYFELRLNAYPYKSSQCYNFGINKISIKGWDFE